MANMQMRKWMNGDKTLLVGSSVIMAHLKWRRLHYTQQPLGVTVRQCRSAWLAYIGKNSDIENESTSSLKVHLGVVSGLTMYLRWLPAGETPGANRIHPHLIAAFVFPNWALNSRIWLERWRSLLCYLDVILHFGHQSNVANCVHLCVWPAHISKW